MITYMRYVRNLEFDKEPDYKFLSKMFSSFINKKQGGLFGKISNQTQEFDWINQKKKLILDRELARKFKGAAKTTSSFGVLKMMRKQNL